MNKKDLKENKDEESKDSEYPRLYNYFEKKIMFLDFSLLRGDLRELSL